MIFQRLQIEAGFQVRERKKIPFSMFSEGRYLDWKLLQEETIYNNILIPTRILFARSSSIKTIFQFRFFSTMNFLSSLKGGISKLSKKDFLFSFAKYFSTVGGGGGQWGS